MNKALYRYVDTKRKLLAYFNCEDEFHIHVNTGYNWRIMDLDGVYFLSYWRTGSKPVDAVIVKKNGEPMIFEKPDLTMVVAIDCIKIAFIMKNSDRVQESC